MYALRIPSIVLALAFALVSVGSLQAQGNAAPVSVTNTIYVGSENGPGQGELGFRFNADGTVLMADKATSNGGGFVQGTWKQQGNTVTITFGDCVYAGTVNGNQITGTASNIGNPGTWAFSVTLSKKL